MEGTQIIITKNGKQVARLIPEDAAVSYLTDSLTGVLKGNFDPDEAKDRGIKKSMETLINKCFTPYARGEITIRTGPLTLCER